MAGCDEAALVAAAVAGRSLAEIAKAGKVSVSTAQRRLKLPEVIAQVRDQRAKHRDETVGRLLAMRDSALSRLTELIDSPDPHVALRAIGMCLNQGAQFDAINEFDRRLHEVEASLAADRGADAEEDDDPFAPDAEAAEGLAGTDGGG
jgi:hypothetical protein